MAKHHITTAATVGVRAGRDEYVLRCSQSGLPAVRQAAQKYSGRRGFARYQEDFGAAIAKLQGTPAPRTHTRSTPTPVVESTPLSIEIASLRAQLALLETRASEPVVPATPKAKKAAPKVAKENLWRPWAIRKYGIPTTVGGTFTYLSKKSGKTSTHQVVRVTADGCFAVKVG